MEHGSTTHLLSVKVNFKEYSVYRMDKNAAAIGKEWDRGIMMAVKNGLKSRILKINVGNVVQ